MSSCISRVTFLLVSRIEGLAFKISRLLSLPAWLIFTLADPKSDRLGYDELLSLISRYQPTSKPSLKDVQEHQIKWANRVARIAKLYSLRTILEVGCGRGIAACHLHTMGFQVYITDIREFINCGAQNAKLKFVTSDACASLPYLTDCFDLTFSINSFEHFDVPEIALDEMLRVTKPGGLIYLTFGPLYYSPWGLHASRRLGMPYPQILFSEETIQRFVDEKRVELASTYGEGSDRTKIGPHLNRYSLGQYHDIFNKRRGSSLKILAYTERTSYSGLTMIVRHSELFKSSVPFESLIVSGIKLLGMKQAEDGN